MNYKRFLSSFLLSLLVLVSFFSFGKGQAYAADLYTGCLSVGAGVIYNAKLGSATLNPCASGDTEVLGGSGITEILAGEGLSGGGDEGEVTIDLSDGGVTTEKIASGSVTTSKLANGSVTAGKLAPNATEKFYTLNLSSSVTTTSSASATFDTINLPVESNVCVMSMWVLQNNDSSKGLTATLEVDGQQRPVYTDTIPFSSSGIGYTIARNHCIANLSAGNHSFGVRIAQFPFETGKQIFIFTGSVMWITAHPTGD